MDYSMSSSWMEGLHHFKYHSLGILSLLGSTVYHDSAVNCGTLPSEEAALLAVLLLWRLFLWICPFVVLLLLQTFSLLEVLFF